MSSLTTCVEISTKDRYFTTLPNTLVSIALQTVSPQKVLIFDDGEQKDLRNESVYQSIFALLNTKGINWEVAFGERKGQVLNHQKAIDRSETDTIWRVDDDDCPEPDSLEKLLIHFKDPKVGAASGMIYVPGLPILSANVCSGKIEDVWASPNLQWSDQKEVIEVDHFNNSFLFRREYAKHGYCKDLSPVGHTEESTFTYGFRVNGYKLILDPSVKIWHMRSPQGGIRSYNDGKLWEHDQQIGEAVLRSYGVELKKNKLIILNCGMGDTIMLKSILPEIKEKYKGYKLQLAVCFPEVFKDDKDIKLLSIAEGMMLDPNHDNHNVYKWCIDNKWSGHLTDAFRKLWL